MSVYWGTGWELGAFGEGGGSGMLRFGCLWLGRVVVGGMRMLNVGFGGDIVMDGCPAVVMRKINEKASPPTSSIGGLQTP